jgi:hypothetical protein
VTDFTINSINANAKLSLFSGIMAGELLYHEVLQVGFHAALASASTPVILLGFVPHLLALYPFFKIAEQIDNQYKSAPVKWSAYFLLSASSILLVEILRLTITAVFISSLTPFTLPIMITAGASSLLILALYLLTKPAPNPGGLLIENKDMPVSACLYSLFTCCLPTRHKAELPSLQASDFKEPS